MADPLHPLAAPQPQGGAWDAPPPGPPADEPPDGLGGLLALAAQGRWHKVVTRCRSATATSTADALAVGAFHVLALLKLQMVEEAAAQVAKLGSLEDAAYAGPRAQGSQSLVPFALRVLRAALPWHQGRQPDALDRLHSLLDWCATQAAAAPQQQPGAQKMWARRHRGVLFLLVSRHCQLRQYAAALTLLDRLLAADASDAEAWTEAGLVMAQLGDLAAAQRSLQHAQGLLQPDGGGSGGSGSAALDEQQRAALAHRSRGLLLFLQRDFRGAAAEYGAAAAADPRDPAAAANNQALALMYSNRLGEAAAALERAFHAAPAALMQEPIVQNLASIYELMAAAGSLGAKRRMAAWVAGAAPDDFQLAATKTGTAGG